MSLLVRTGGSREADSARPADRLLGAAEVVLLVMGGTIGADVYVASALGAPLGPSGLYVWAAGALMALAVTMAFAVCALAVPETGGPYLYVRRAFGPLPGFLAGWAVLASQWAALVALPVAFWEYLRALAGEVAAAAPWLGPPARLAPLVLAVLAVCRGPRPAALVTDALTVVRLVPLLVVLVSGAAWAALHPAQAASHLLPLDPPPAAAARSLLAPVFWAYAGFELGSIPAGQVREPRRTIPLALLLGTGAAAGLYLLANLITMLVLPPAVLAASPAPLVACARAAVAGLLPAQPAAPAVVEALLGAGVLVSIGGTATAITFALTCLMAAMASTGLLPPALGRVHPRTGAPLAAVAALTVPAALAALFAGLAGVVRTAVVCSAFAYLATSLAAWRLGTSRLHRLLSLAATAACLTLFALADRTSLAAGGALLLAGGVLYAARRHAPAPVPEAWAEVFTALVALSPAGSPPVALAAAPVPAAPHAAGAAPAPAPSAGAWGPRFAPSVASLLARPRVAPPDKRSRTP